MESVVASKLKKMLAVLALSILLAIINMVFSDSVYRASFSLSIILVTVLLIYFSSIEKLHLFDPLFLFSCMYMLIPCTVVYLILTDFKTNLYIDAVSYDIPFSELLERSLFYCLIAYIFILIGYYRIPFTHNQQQFDYEGNSIISDKVLNTVKITFIFIGVLNFLYNVYLFAGGNVITYLSNVGLRSKEFQMGGTTLGYTFLMLAVLMDLFSVFRRNEKLKLKNYFLIIVSVVIRASTGRIFHTISEAGIIIGILYYKEFSEKKNFSNRKYFVYGGLAFISVLLFYIIRLVSSIRPEESLGSFWMDFKNTLSSISYYIFDRGNTPNVAILPQIFEKWNDDVGYMFGESYFYPFNTIFPDSLKGIVNAPSELIKEVWYSSVEGGHLPPTCVGEAYANFGIIGITLGMFILGMFFKLWKNVCQRTSNYWIMVIGVYITVSFILLLPKTEFSNFPLFQVILICITYALLRIATKVETIWLGRKINDNSHF